MSRQVSFPWVNGAGFSGYARERAPANPATLGDRSLNGPAALAPAGWCRKFETGLLEKAPAGALGVCRAPFDGEDILKRPALRPMTARPTVFIIDDDDAVRETLAMHVGRARLACQTFPNAEVFLEQLDHEGPGCVVADVMLPGMNGLDLLKTLRQRDAGFPVILLTGYADVDLVVTAFRTGASDFLVKPVTGFKLIEVVQSAIAHSTERFRAHARAREMEARLQGLTPRERDILPLLITGATAKQIARTLSISHRTVEHYRHQVLLKFGVRSVLELAEVLKR